MNEHADMIQDSGKKTQGEAFCFDEAGARAGISRLWREILGLPHVGLDDNFFEAGGTSLLAAVLLDRINQEFGERLPIAAIFEAPTVRAMAGRLRTDRKGEPEAGTHGTSVGPGSAPHGSTKEAARRETGSGDIAILGMTGRFPGADSVEEFWRNLADGVESITFFDRDPGPAGEQFPDGYVAARPILRNAEIFDAAFFGVYPKEAEQMDPQHRVFLECAWEVLERAGYDPAHTREAVGVFAGCSMNTYFMQNLAADRQYLERFTAAYQVGSYITMLGNDKDFLATRISYKLNLRGPSITVQSACSTSLVAVCQACESLRAGGCDMALAGAVSITFPQRRGYLPQEGGLASLDGHCRPFDHRASGTVFGHGAAVLLLKRLEQAVADGDQVLGVIRGFAVNNDGSAKVGYTAPSVEGQAQVIARAQKMAGVSAESITYLEAHGTGTPLGDPIEVAALTKAFRASTGAQEFCALGTAKANVGHLDVAAGATGLIKTLLQMQHRTIPKLLHFERPNPHLDLAGSPFFIRSATAPWQSRGLPLRAGVSAFGVGGTNAHVVVEEAPPLPASGAGRQRQLFVWSAKTSAAAAAIGTQLADCFAQQPDLNPADAAYTLQVSRSRHRHRRALVAGTLAEARAILTSASGAGMLSEDRPWESPGVIFCFPGQGVQSLGMGHQLFLDEPVFRDCLKRCDETLRPLLGESLLQVLYPETRDAVHEERLNQTVFAQPAIFTFEYALAQLWISWGVRPAAIVGHSVGEYVAACLAGVLSLEDALALIAARGRLMQDLAPGSMLAVRAPEETVTRLMGSELDLAAVNSPQLCVVSGSGGRIDAFSQQLSRQGIQSRKLATSHAFHSRMVEPALGPFFHQAAAVCWGEPTVPYVSTLTGRPIPPQELAWPEYWTRQLRQPVRFHEAIRELLKTPQRIFLEVGPGETAAQMIRQTVLAAGTARPEDAPIVLSTLGGRQDASYCEEDALLRTLGRLWTAGVEPDWPAVHAGQSRRRVLLPTYPFERKRFWVEPPESKIFQAAAMPENPASMARNEESGMAHTLGDGSFLPSADQPFSSAEGPFMNVGNLDAAGQQDAGWIEEIKTFVADLSGADLSAADGDASFLDLGFDSLFLTQLTQGIQAKYRIKLTFRQIMEQYPTLGTLAAHLQASAPPEARVRVPAPAASAAIAAPVPIPVPLPTAVPALLPAASTASLPASYEALFASQMQMLNGLFAQQFELLRGQQAASAAAPQPVPAAAGVVAMQAQAPAANPQPAPPQAHATAAPDVVPARETKPVFTPFRPLQRGNAGGLNAVQERYLEELVRSYNQRTAASKSYTQKHRGVFADGRVVSGFHAQIKDLIYPLVVDRASGPYLWDRDGNRYVDILNGYGAILYGHSPEFIVEAVRKQLEIGFPIGPLTGLAGECAQLISELTGMERVTFCNTGSEAVMGAMRLARTVTGRSLVVVFAGDYHGSFDEVLVKAAGQQRSMPAAPGIPRESVANMLVLEYGAAESLEILRRRADEIAAVLVEPVQSRHPELQPVEFLREIRRITAESSSALIFDEVVTGFRTHPGGMQALFGIRADLATYGKVVAGGLPVGVLAGSAAYMDALDGGQWQYGDDSFPEAGVTFYAGTFMRHPLAMAAVKASLEHLKSAGPALQQDLAARTSALVGDLGTMFREFSYPSAIGSFSSWFYFAVPGEPRLARLLHFHLREQGVHLQEGFPCFLTTSHTAADLDFVREAFHRSLRAMHAGEALGQPKAAAPGPELAAEMVSHSAAPAAAASSAPRDSEAFLREMPITEPQREILLGTQLGDEANCAFNESTSLVLEGALDEPALLSSLEAIVARHACLRARVDPEGEILHLAASLPLPLERRDLSALPPDAQEAELKLEIEREASTSFDLYSGPLFRLRLIRLSARKHVLISTAHHIVFDGWSTNVLYSELSLLYNARVSRRAASLPAPLSFQQYAARQSERAATTEHASVESFWLEQFKTLPPPLELPIDRARGRLRTNAGDTRRYRVSPELYQAVRKAGARQGSTLFATLLSAYCLLMHRLCRQPDLVIGIPMAGQSQTENGSALVGHCVNFLPIRSRYTPEESLSGFLKQTRKALLDAQDHQDYTYGTLLRKLKPAIDPARLPLVEVQFNLEQVGAGLRFEGLSAELRANPKTRVNMDLFFNFVDRGSELWLDCDYNTDLLDPETIDRWFEHLEAILRAMVDDIAQPASNVSLLSPAQMEKILTDWNRTSISYPRDGSVHRIFEQQAALTPEAVAVVGERTLTYAELNEKANQLARFLGTTGVRPGARVALCLERSLEAIVSLLAVLKAGAVYVPIDPSYPAARLEYLIADSQSQVLLTLRSVAANLPGLAIEVISLDADWAAIALQETGNPGIERQADDPAYVMYTSGSTGNPKGVLVPHRAVLRLVKNNSFASFSADEVFLQMAPLSFDAATFEIWGALLNGARLALGPQGRLAPEEIGRLIRAHRVTTLWLTAALFHLMVTEHLEALRPLKQLLAGGDVLSLAHVRRVIEALPELRVINGYGPTENTTFTCCHRITAESLAGGTVPIGRPIANTRIYLLDSAGNPVPPGVAGELYAAGDGLALGYLGAPQQTAEKFLEHRLPNGRTERLYRTGDLARYRADGVVEFLGREDTQVKIRGYRIELSEIEHALETSPWVRSAVVSVRNDWVTAHDSPGDKRLAAYVVPAQAGDPAAVIQELRKHLEERLPQYMQPAAIMLLESLPRTLNGKVDRRALPAPQPERLMRQRKVSAPRNEKEALLAGIWSKVLGIEEAGVDESIFELGGDSLLIFRITSLANQAGLPLTARHIFQHRTITAICEALEGAQEKAPGKTAGGIQAVPRARYRRPQTTLQ
ncbi:MAG TPA: amino acid adenylation domain-containing protein [Acidobacteriaceae bacterium]|nr:amino acid adenylation domain-containing protein [Acidobacteriaceae bacterium]